MHYTFGEPQLYKPPVSFSHTFTQGIEGTMIVRKVPLWEQQQRLVKRLVDMLVVIVKEKL